MNASTIQTSVAELNAVLQGTPFLKPYGFSVVSCAVGECVLQVPFDPALERPGGIVSGMTLMGAADVAMWLAIMTQRGTAEHWVTSDMKTAFLRSATPGGLPVHRAGSQAGQAFRVWHGRMPRCRRRVLLAHHVLTYVLTGA